MATKVIMPKQGLQMTEGTIISWLVSEGGEAVKGEPLFEMETDKLTITMDSPASGTLLKIVKGEGETVPITEAIAVIGEPGEDISELLSTPAEKEDSAEEQAPKTEEKRTAAAAETPKDDTRAFISPRARKLASEKGVDYSRLAGSGPGGLIVERDVKEAAGRSPAITPLAKKVAEMKGVDISDVNGTGPGGKIVSKDISGAEQKLVPLTGMRRAIADKMKQSLSTSAQATVQVTADMSECARLVESRKNNGGKVSYTALVIKAAGRALADFPEVNSEWTDKGILRKRYVNIGVAVALDEGLVVPVIRDAHIKDIRQITEEVGALAERAKSGQLKPGECSGGTFTVSNLGMYGIDSFTAILNPPETGILAIGGIRKAPVVVNDAVEVRPLMSMTLTYDHRVVDGALAARFTARVRDYLENPYLML